MLRSKYIEFISFDQEKETLCLLKKYAVDGYILVKYNRQQTKREIWFKEGYNEEMQSRYQRLKDEDDDSGVPCLDLSAFDRYEGIAAGDSGCRWSDLLANHKIVINKCENPGIGIQSLINFASENNNYCTYLINGLAKFANKKKSTSTSTSSNNNNSSGNKYEIMRDIEHLSYEKLLTECSDMSIGEFNKTCTAKEKHEKLIKKSQEEKDQAQIGRLIQNLEFEHLDPQTKQPKWFPWQRKLLQRLTEPFIEDDTASLSAVAVSRENNSNDEEANSCSESNVVHTLISNHPDPTKKKDFKKVIFVCDIEGHCGKSTFGAFLSNKKVLTDSNPKNYFQVLSISLGKNPDDYLFLIEPEANTWIFDFTREESNNIEKQAIILYSLFEKLISGNWISDKYSGVKPSLQNKINPQVVVFMNTFPTPKSKSSLTEEKFEVYEMIKSTKDWKYLDINSLFLEKFGNRTREAEMLEKNYTKKELAYQAYDYKIQSINFRKQKCDLEKEFEDYRMAQNLKLSQQHKEIEDMKKYLAEMHHFYTNPHRLLGPPARGGGGGGEGAAEANSATQISGMGRTRNFVRQSSGFSSINNGSSDNSLSPSPEKLIKGDTLKENDDFNFFGLDLDKISNGDDPFLI